VAIQVAIQATRRERIKAKAHPQAVPLRLAAAEHLLVAEVVAVAERLPVVVVAEVVVRRLVAVVPSWLPARVRQAVEVALVEVRALRAVARADMPPVRRIR
jgi:hypothetical protein